MILAIANQKGGVGKTTTAINLGAALAFRGFRTLLIDLDPQANSTMSYVDIRAVTRSLYDVIAEERCPMADIVLPSPVKNLSVVPVEDRAGEGRGTPGGGSGCPLPAEGPHRDGAACV